MDEICKEKATFICNFGTYQFEFMPFRLKNSEETFQKMMEITLVNETNVKCYVDDIVIHLATGESHVKNLENVFGLLFKHGLRIRSKRCSFMQTCVELLGNCIDNEGIHTDERKVKNVRDTHPPSSREQLRSFLVTTSYYRIFIENFANIPKPCSRRLQKKSSSSGHRQCRSHSKL